MMLNIFAKNFLFQIQDTMFVKRVKLLEAPRIALGQAHRHGRGSQENIELAVRSSSPIIPTRANRPLPNLGQPQATRAQFM